MPCVPFEPLKPRALPAATSLAFSVDSLTAPIFGSCRAMGGFTQWAGRQKGGDGSRAPRPGSRGGGSSLVRALRHGEFGFRGPVATLATPTSRLFAWTGARRRLASVSRVMFGPCKAIPRTAVTTCPIWPRPWMVSSGLLPGGGPGGRLANHFVVGPMPSQWSEARGFRRGSSRPVQPGGPAQGWSPALWRSGRCPIGGRCPRRGHFRSSRLTTSAGTALRCCRLHLVREVRAEAVEATAAVMGASAAAAGSADVPASAAGADGAEAEDADTEPSSSDSELPDTTAPAVAKAEERSGAAVAAPQERSPADVDMASDMTDAAVADPSLTVGELVDKTKQKLEYMSAYMEGASRMVGFEGALASRAGDDHRRVLEHAAKLLQKSEEFLQDQAAEAGVAASGAPSSGGAAPSSDARLLEGIDAFMGNSSATKAEDQDRTGPHLHRQH